MKTLDFSYFIERYNSGEMDHVEKNWFEKELIGNESLQHEVKLRKSVDNALIRHDLIELRNKLSSLEKTRKEKQTSTAGKKGVGIRFAAAIASLVVVGASYLMLSSFNPQRLYERNFEPYSFNSSSRAGTSEVNLEFSAALSLYQAGNYIDAAEKFKLFLNKMPGEMNAYLMYGVAEMKNNQIPLAEKSFTTILNHGDNDYTDHASWYLALCYLKSGEKDQAIKELEAIAGSEVVYKARARKLLRRIR